MSISVRLFLFILVGISLHSCSRKNSEKPNVVLIMADDMGYECLSINGCAEYNTPVLDELANNGINVTHCISQPICTPSRVKIMTGMYNYRNYETFEYLNPKNFTFGRLMKDAGYNTAIAGKWQLNGRHFNKPGWQDINRPFDFGFDRFCLWQVTKPKKEGERFANPLIVKNGKEMTGLEDSYGPDVFADFVIDFIEESSEEPFFIYYPMVLVHDPFVPTPDSEAWQNPERRYEKDTAYFKGMVEYADKIVGRIVKKLEEENILDNTLLIFTGDNGTHVRIYTDMKDGTKYKGGKGSMFDPGTRVPLIISWPERIKKPFTHHGLVEFSDFFATFADLTGRQKQSDGKSLIPLITGKKDTHRETVLVHYNPHWGRFKTGRFIRNLEYKLYKNGEFYNCENDPLEEKPIETNNLDPETAKIYEMLAAELNKHPDGDIVDPE